MMLLAWIFGCPMVWTEDTDGAIRLRIAKKTPFGKWVVASIVSHSVSTLELDGTTKGVSYVARWMPANDKAKLIIPRS